MDYSPQPPPQQENKKEEFLYKMKLKSAIYVFVLFLLLSNDKTYTILNLILPSFDILNDKNEPTLLAKCIIAFLFSLIIFIF